MNTKTQLGRQTIEGMDHVRIYHGRVLLSEEKEIPILSRRPTDIEITNWLYITKQEEVQTQFRHTVHVIGNETEAEPVDHFQHPLVEAVKALHGVEYAVGASYQLIVIKGRQFTWEELESHILKLMTTFSLDLESIKFQDDPASPTEEQNANLDSNQEAPSDL